MPTRSNLQPTAPKSGYAIASDTDAADLQDTIERLAASLRVAVIYAGDKSKPGSVIYQTQNSRSWKSYEAVASDIADSLRRLGFRHVTLMPDDMHLGDRLRRERIHLAWLNSGGVQGYNPAAHAPAMLEMLGIPYIGHDPLAASILDNKHAFKRGAVCAGLPTAPFITWHMSRGTFRPDLNSRFKRAFGGYQGPFIVKPVSGRASLNVMVVDDCAGLPDAVADVDRATGNTVLIEQFLAGREVCIAVAGPIVSRGRSLARSGTPFTFAALERVLASDERIFTSMDVQPITGARFKAVDAAVDQDLYNSMHRLARDVYLEFSLGSIIRLDLRANEAGKLYILEANPKPDLKNSSGSVTSLITAGLPACGMDYDDLILSLFADRIDHLLTYRRNTMQHVVDLLDSPAQAPGQSYALAMGELEDNADLDGNLTEMLDAAADANVTLLTAALNAARTGERQIKAAADAPKSNPASTQVA
jgi:D-alanine-D-alanine ligase